MQEDLTQDETLNEDQQGFTVSDDFITRLREELNGENFAEVREECLPLSAADTAEILSKIDFDHALQLVDVLGEDMSSDVYAYLDNDLVTRMFANMSDWDVASIINQMESDDALDLIEDLDEETQGKILLTLSSKMRAALEEGLTFPEDSAGRLMQRTMVAVPQFWTVGKTLDYLRVAKDSLPDNFYDIIIVDPMHHVVGEVPAGKILKAQRTARMSDLALDNFHPVKAETDQEDVAHLFRREALVSAPVVNEDNRLIGVITVDDIVGVIDEEAEEDLLKLAGMSDTHIYRDVLYTARSRFSWLAVNLLTAIAASIVIGFFEGTINQIVALAVLMPIVASMGGNAGMQAMTVAVRGLATKELSRANAHKIIGKEVLVGAINGASFAIITGIVTALWFQNPALGMIIATAMVLNLIVAGFSGASIPVLLDRFGMDPAVSSSVFLTTVTDVIGFFAFLGLAAMFLV
tara:strand:- start:2565 stop:3956 length:1392 start_codon:yes stop_codon:yes gene_type:complete